ncbi:hypothetical protein, partial [Enterococcus faecalis]|uniref:hypothetical protein n=1 Tax=Enterococcus faecalis TaxID=1351 RepID=UPI003D6B74B6
QGSGQEKQIVEQEINEKNKKHQQSLLKKHKKDQHKESHHRTTHEQKKEKGQDAVGRLLTKRQTDYDRGRIPLPVFD